MDELMISGKRYLSSLRAARDHGYHSDYIGQLIRGTKVKGQKVGRAWYVDADSLAAYLGKENTPSPKTLEESSPALASVAEEQKREQKVSEEAPAAFVKESKAEGSVESPITFEKDPQEHPIILTKIAEAPEPALTVRIANIESREEVEEEKAGGLLYISDDEPLMPEIRKNKSASRETGHPTSSPITIQPRIQNATISKHGSEGFFVRWIVLAFFALMVLTSVMALSVSLVKDLSVGSTESASVQFSFPY